MLGVGVWLLAASVAAPGVQVYRWVDERGRTHYGDVPPAGQVFDRFEVRPGKPLLVPGFPERRIAAGRERPADAGEGGRRAQSARVAELPSPGCFTPSAELLGEGSDPFEPVVPRPLQDGESADLDRLFGAMEGRWHGIMTEVLCRGSTAQAGDEVRRYDVHVAAERDSTGVLALAAELDGLESRIRHREQFWWLLRGGRLRFGDRGTVDADMPRWDLGIVAIGAGALDFQRKFRFRTVGGGSAQRLEVRSMRGARDTFSLREWFYTQDVLDSTRTWVLTR